MSDDGWRRWADDYRAAAARERAELRGRPMPPEDAFAAALALLVFDEAINGSPFGREDAVSRREDDQARAAWATLRTNWRQ